MVVSDVAWWVVAMRLANRRLWRVMMSVFMGAQLAAHLSAMAGIDWPRHVPKAVLVSVVVWHYGALGLAFAEALRHLRSFTLKDPAEFLPILRERCARAGVAVVFVPPLSGVRAYGVSRWLHSSKALIQLSLRGKPDDHLWLTFYHEAGDVMQHGKRAVFVEESDGEDAARDPREAEADAFAQECLIPSGDYDRFCLSGDFNLAAIRRFASEVGIAPGIVAGRLLHERKIPFSRANQLKHRFNFGDKRYHQPSVPSGTHKNISRAAQERLSSFRRPSGHP